MVTTRSSSRLGEGNTPSGSASASRSSTPSGTGQKPPVAPPSKGSTKKPSAAGRGAASSTPSGTGKKPPRFAPPSNGSSTSASGMKATSARKTTKSATKKTPFPSEGFTAKMTISAKKTTASPAFTPSGTGQKPPRAPPSKGSTVNGTSASGKKVTTNPKKTKKSATKETPTSTEKRGGNQSIPNLTMDGCATMRKAVAKGEKCPKRCTIQGSSIHTSSFSNPEKPHLGLELKHCILHKKKIVPPTDLPPASLEKAIKKICDDACPGKEYFSKYNDYFLVLGLMQEVSTKLAVDVKSLSFDFGAFVKQKRSQFLREPAPATDSEPFATSVPAPESSPVTDPAPAADPTAAPAPSASETNTDARLDRLAQLTTSGYEQLQASNLKTSKDVSELSGTVSQMAKVQESTIKTVAEHGTRLEEHGTRLSNLEVKINHLTGTCRKRWKEREQKFNEGDGLTSWEPNFTAPSTPLRVQLFANSPAASRASSAKTQDLVSPVKEEDSDVDYDSEDGGGKPKAEEKVEMDTQKDAKADGDSESSRDSGRRKAPPPLSTPASKRRKVKAIRPVRSTGVASAPSAGATPMDTSPAKEKETTAGDANAIKADDIAGSPPNAAAQNDRSWLKDTSFGDDDDVAVGSDVGTNSQEEGALDTNSVGNANSEDSPVAPAAPRRSGWLSSWL